MYTGQAIKRMMYGDRLIRPKSPKFPSDGLLAYYKLDETAGTTIVDSTGNYNGFIGGATINQSGAAINTGKGYYLNNLTSSTKATLPSNTAFDFGINNFSIAFWIKGNWNSTYGTAFIGSTAPRGLNSFGVKRDHSGGGNAKKMSIDQNNGPTKSIASTELSENTWYHFVISRNGDTMTIYKNGAYDNSSTGWSTNNCNLTKGTYQPSIGWRQPNANDFVQVYLDELGFWTRALSEEESAILYNSGNGLQYPS